MGDYLTDEELDELERKAKADLADGFTHQEIAAETIQRLIAEVKELRARAMIATAMKEQEE